MNPLFLLPNSFFVSRFKSNEVVKKSENYMNYPVYEKSNKDVFRDYIDPSKRDSQNLNCHILINRLNNGDMSVLEFLRKIYVIQTLDSSDHPYPKDTLEVINWYDRSNEDVYSDYENTENKKYKYRNCNILIDRAVNGDNEALEKLRLVALDEVIDGSSSNQASNALNEMRKD